MQRERGVEEERTREQEAEKGFIEDDELAVKLLRQKWPSES